MENSLIEFRFQRHWGRKIDFSLYCINRVLSLTFAILVTLACFVRLDVAYWKTLGTWDRYKLIGRYLIWWYRKIRNILKGRKWALGWLQSTNEEAVETHSAAATRVLLLQNGSWVRPLARLSSIRRTVHFNTYVFSQSLYYSSFSIVTFFFLVSIFVYIDL